MKTIRTCVCYKCGYMECWPEVPECPEQECDGSLRVQVLPHPVYLRVLRLQRQLKVAHNEIDHLYYELHDSPNGE